MCVGNPEVAEGVRHCIPCVEACRVVGCVEASKSASKVASDRWPDHTTQHFLLSPSANHAFRRALVTASPSLGLGAGLSYPAERFAGSSAASSEAFGSCGESFR